MFSVPLNHVSVLGPCGYAGPVPLPIAASARKVNGGVEPYFKKIRETESFLKKTASPEQGMIVASDVAGDISSDVRAALSLGLISASIAQQNPSLMNYDAAVSASSISGFFISAPILYRKCLLMIQQFFAKCKEVGLSSAIEQESTASNGYLVTSTIQTTATGVLRGAQIATLVNNLSPSLAPQAPFVAGIAGQFCAAFGIIPTLFMAYSSAKALFQAASYRHQLKRAFQEKGDAKEAFDDFVRSRDVELAQFFTYSQENNTFLQTLYVERRKNLDTTSPSVTSAKEPQAIEEELKTQFTSQEALLEKYQVPLFKDYEKYSYTALLGYVVAFQEKIAKEEENLKASLGDTLYEKYLTADANKAEVFEEMLQALSLNPFSLKSNQGKQLLVLISAITLFVSSLFAVLSAYFNPVIFSLVSTVFWLFGALVLTALDIKDLYEAFSKKDPDFNYKKSVVRILGLMLFAGFAAGVATFAVFCALNPTSLPVVISFALIYALWLAISIYVHYKAAQAPQKEEARQMTSVLDSQKTEHQQDAEIFGINAATSCI